MYLCLELDFDVDEICLDGDVAFEVVFFECMGDYWSIIIHIDESEWLVLEDDGSEEILDVKKWF